MNLRHDQLSASPGTGRPANREHDPNNASLNLRDARPEELDAVAVLLRDAYQQYQSSIPADAWKLYLEDIMNVRSRLSESQLIVATLDDKLAGAVTLYLNAPGASRQVWPEGWAGVRLLAVHPAYRGRRIGHALMDECVRRCRERGIRTMGLHTTELMDVACRMYERMGFVRVPELDFHPASGVLIMAYRLDL